MLDKNNFSLYGHMRWVKLLRTKKLENDNFKYKNLRTLDFASNTPFKLKNWSNSMFVTASKISTFEWKHFFY